jgi:hypothetical protein
MRKLIIRLLLVVAAALAVLVTSASAETPLRLDFSAPFGDPLESGWVQTQFMESDLYHLKGAAPNMYVFVNVLYYLDDATCSGPPTQDLFTGWLGRTDSQGNLTVQHRYSGELPPSIVGHVIGVAWDLSLSSDNISPGRVYYVTPCATFDVR